MSLAEAYGIYILRFTYTQQVCWFSFLLLWRSLYLYLSCSFILFYRLIRILGVRCLLNTIKNVNISFAHSSYSCMFFPPPQSVFVVVAAVVRFIVLFPISSAFLFFSFRTILHKWMYVGGWVCVCECIFFYIVFLEFTSVGMLFGSIFLFVFVVQLM